ncbi:DUF6715 family protein [uncultured Acetatifactor sp.]|jgi:hypothetical protein|uniref:DUF6715 family protein n=1 Tax=uncultured Acetatifactor sp. TaxID=1671927 RepID=UPI0025F0F86B|nr:DUF6715 family protein [uncultured Acetatifactor sp.]MCI8697351.1 hypothetical protein [Lachnospiraceae bacterium]MCI9232241.1 hypothetical protein [Lachnospiraceae bacterium]MCI9573989.1 hypothetical protein [Lachnospiraceae bacterium]
MKKNTSKNTTKVAIIFLVLIVAVVAYFAYLSNKSREVEDEAAMTAVKLVLSRDLENNYPPTVKEVMKYYADIQKCLYSQECLDEEAEQLGMKARALFDDELLAANDVTNHLLALKSEITSFQEDSRQITAASVASSANVDTFTEDGYEFARIHCIYTVLDGGQSNLVDMVYLLRRDGNRRWKIYGWDLAQNVNPTD